MKLLTTLLIALSGLIMTSGTLSAYSLDFTAPSANTGHNIAFQYLIDKANEGNAEAQYQLGEAFDIGHITEANKLLAHKWYKRAAEQGHIKAQYNLGLMLLEGDGVAQDVEEARNLFLLAAKRGDSDAQYALGYSYQDEENVKSYAWYSIALENGNIDAEIALDELSTFLSKDELREASILKQKYSP